MGLVKCERFRGHFLCALLQLSPLKGFSKFSFPLARQLSRPPEEDLKSKVKGWGDIVHISPILPLLSRHCKLIFNSIIIFLFYFLHTSDACPYFLMVGDMSMKDTYYLYFFSLCVEHNLLSHLYEQYTVSCFHTTR